MASGAVMRSCGAVYVRFAQGLFKMSGEVFGWKNRRNGKVYQYKSADIADAQWIHCGADQYQLKIVLGAQRNDSIIRFDGFHKKVGFVVLGEFRGCVTLEGLTAVSRATPAPASRMIRCLAISPKPCIPTSASVPLCMLRWACLCETAKQRLYATATCTQPVKQCMHARFELQNFDDIRRHFQDQFKLPLHTKNVAHLGWHWGDVSMDGNNLKVSVEGCPAFEVNAQDIVQVTTPSKNDLAIELLQDDTRDQAEDLLLEIRLFQPATGDEETNSHLQSLKEASATSFRLFCSLLPECAVFSKLVKKSGVAETKMESIALLNDVPLLVPRGRYEIDIGRRALKFHGKSYDYTILYTNINRMFLVPRPNSPHVNFILSLDNAMRQGQTSYPFVVLQFDSENVTSVEVNLEEAELKEKGLEKQLEGKTFDVITRILKSLIGKNVIVPGDFKSVKHQYGITCSYRAQSGHLYPLNRSFLFIVKPVIFVRFEDVVSVEFSRTGASTTNRFFAFTVSCRGGVEHEFTSIDRNEYEPLVEFLTQKGIRIKNVEKSNAARTSGLQEAELPTDEDDDDYGGESDTDEDFEDEEDDDESEESASESNEEEDGEKDKKRKSHKRSAITYGKIGEGSMGETGKRGFTEKQSRCVVSFVRFLLLLGDWMFELDPLVCIHRR
ncbi:structure specific recognition protein [Cyclospora cayetanensis]|uniref:FACT complex subunit SSRP1 n=1 Tax=Cyclospora cayetanensis TaxID=88456 RepID=A0A1D3D2V9_9EIME|nr:structure specific recognition protein [Cyclospora cayetanensis]